MAMTGCKECGAAISTSARACPKCDAVVPKAKLWPWMLGVPVAMGAMFLIYGASIPEYQSQARKVRDVCEKIASWDQRHICERNYQQAIREGHEKANPQPPPRPYVPTAEEVRKRDEAAKALLDSQVKDCKANLGAKTKDFQRYMVAKEYWSAALSLRVCADVLDDPKLRALVAGAEIKKYAIDIENPATPSFDRVLMIEALQRDYPDQAKKYASLLEKLRREDAK